MALLLHTVDKTCAGRAQWHWFLFPTSVFLPLHADLWITQFLDSKLDICVVPLWQVVLQTVHCLASVLLHSPHSEMRELVHAWHWVVRDCRKFVVREDPLVEVCVIGVIETAVCTRSLTELVSLAVSFNWSAC